MSKRDVEKAYATCEEYRAKGERPETGFERSGDGSLRWAARLPSLAGVLARIELAWRGQL